jgi:hypothetical protein
MSTELSQTPLGSNGFGSVMVLLLWYKIKYELKQKLAWGEL